MEIKTNASKSAIFVITGFFDRGFKYEPYLWNACHDLMQKSYEH